MSIVSALSEASTAARRAGLPLPVISTDLRTCRMLVEEMAREIGCRFHDLAGPNHPSDIVCMFDGVKLVRTL